MKAARMPCIFLIKNDNKYGIIRSIMNEVIQKVITCLRAKFVKNSPMKTQWEMQNLKRRIPQSTSCVLILVFEIRKFTNLSKWPSIRWTSVLVRKWLQIRGIIEYIDSQFLETHNSSDYISTLILYLHIHISTIKSRIKFDTHCISFIKLLLPFSLYNYTKRLIYTLCSQSNEFPEPCLFSFFYCFSKLLKFS